MAVAYGSLMRSSTQSARVASSPYRAIPSCLISRGHTLGRISISASAAAAPSASRTQRAPPKRDEVITGDPANNVSDYIFDKIGVNLHHQVDHPIGMIKEAIHDYFDARQPGVFAKLDVRAAMHAWGIPAQGVGLGHRVLARCAHSWQLPCMHAWSVPGLLCEWG